MQTALGKAVALILSKDAELLDILGVTADMSLQSSIIVLLLAFARAIAEVGAVSMVGGAISWKTNVMTTAIMQYPIGVIFLWALRWV